ncbi:hypothetical protein QKU58_gp123 [Pyramimonas orientalis virus]|uniref:Minor capsid protein P8 central region domain-containing protein n=1 Tax=Pyramimonas orientalis virus 01B TaxID=3134525 RepID=A0A7M3UNF7_9VIRU|nr:hypothetical protein QKU58_gp123 [Pyramimonas orientalis virus]QOI90208.1 hypothetical protein HWQ62_00071 [Pyramimonas orientalis virus]
MFSNKEDNAEKIKNLTSYKFFTDDVDNNDFKTQGIKSIHTDNPISELFFSKHNISILQNGIRYSVFKRTSDKSIIGEQSENELLIVMRSLYLQYCKHKPYNIIEQVKELNEKVLDFAVPRILVELNQYENYKKDASSLPIPLEHAQNVSSTGTNILYNKEF